MYRFKTPFLLAGVVFVLKVLFCVLLTHPRKRIGLNCSVFIFSCDSYYFILFIVTLFIISLGGSTSIVSLKVHPNIWSPTIIFKKTKNIYLIQSNTMMTANSYICLDNNIHLIQDNLISSRFIHEFGVYINSSSTLYSTINNIIIIKY